MSSSISNPSIFKTSKSENVTRVAIATSFGYLAGRLIASINPVCSAIFTLVASSIHVISKEVFRKSSSSDNICFLSAFVSLTVGYITANYFATFTVFHGLTVFSFGVISVLALQIIMDGMKEKR